MEVSVMAILYVLVVLVVFGTLLLWPEVMVRIKSTEHFYKVKIDKITFFLLLILSGIFGLFVIALSIIGNAMETASL